MQIFVTLENAAGVKLGAGEITSAYGFEYTNRLSRAGRFAFTVPLNDPRLVEISSDGRAVLSEKRIARVWGVVPFGNGLGALRDLGGGVIDRIARTAPDTLTVEGDNLLRELTYRSVLGLQNFAISESVVGPGSVKLEDATTDPSTYTDKTPPSNVHLQEFDSYLLVGGLQPFLTMRFDLGAQVNNNAAENNFGFATGADSFSEIEPFSDGTVNAGDPLNQDGTIRWTSRAGGWEAVTIDGSTLYWIRMDVTQTLDPVDITQIWLGVAVPTTLDLSNIMAFAPSGWTLDTTDWYASTINGSFYRFSDENVLEALIKTAEITGEHFRLGDGREVEWMRKDLPASGVHAVAVGDPTGGAATVCYITDIEEVIESYELATRVYGRGAGNGTEAIDFRDKTTADPANYTTGVESVVQTDSSTEQFWYIESDLSVATYGRIEKFYDDKSITSADGFAAVDAVASDTIWQAALNWLQKHDQPQYFYRLGVVGLQEELKVGTTIRVQYRRVVEEDGVPQLSWDIDEDLIIIETVNRVGSAGAYTVGLTVSTVAAWYETDAEIIAKMKRDQVDYMKHNQGVSKYNIK